MAEIEFHRVDIIIAAMGEAPATPANVIVCWELARVHSGLGDVEFQVERCLSPKFDEGQFSVLVDGMVGIPGQLIYSFIDITPNLFSQWRRYFYRIRAVSGSSTFLSKPKTWETDPRTHELAIIEDHDRLLKYFVGSPAFAFIERTTESSQCICYDRTSGRPRSSNCKLCLGTGRQKPYFEPIPMFVDFNPASKVIKITPAGEMEPHAKSCWTSAFPLLKPGDIIYEVGPATLWRINAVDSIRPQGTTIQQMLTLGAIDNNEVEYGGLLPQIPDATLLGLVREWEEIKRERMF